LLIYGLFRISPSSDPTICGEVLETADGRSASLRFCCSGSLPPSKGKLEKEAFVDEVGVETEEESGGGEGEVGRLSILKE
jgi:hypothetical protein